MTKKKSTTTKPTAATKKKTTKKKATTKTTPKKSTKTKKKASAKTAKKKTTKKKSGETKKKPGTTQTTNDKPKLSDLKSGSTRMRMFKALNRHKKTGLTAKQIKEKTGMKPNSGHLAVLLNEETEKGRVKKGVMDLNGKDICVYTLSKQGVDDLKKGNIDRNKYAGKRIGQEWSDNRWEGEKDTKSTKKKKKAVKKKTAKK